MALEDLILIHSTKGEIPACTFHSTAHYLYICFRVPLCEAVIGYPSLDNQRQ